MIYLDYSATTPTSDEVLDTFVAVSKKFIGNPNSMHKLGIEANNLINDATKQIADILKVEPKDIIYTSGSSESNNTAIKGVCLKYENRGNHIITSPLEHSSIYGPINYLTDLGFEVDFVKLDENGLVDLENLKSLMRDTTILVTIASVNSEVGVLQPIDEIGKIVKQYPKCFFHCDMTQSIGKINCDLTNCDLVSFSAHKFFGIKGIGCLINKGVSLEPLVHGGKSTTVYRSGTPAVSLIASIAKALRLAYLNIDEKNKKIKEIKNYIIENLDKRIIVNSNEYSIPHILNFSVIGIKPEVFQHAMEEDEIYISTQSACSIGNAPSKAVMAVTNDSERASSSVRVSISSLTTMGEAKEFVRFCNKRYNELRLK